MIDPKKIEKLSDSQLLKLYTLAKLKQTEQAQNNLLDFARAIYPEFSNNWFHNKLYSIVDYFAKGKLKKLIITVPPQHGKSFCSTIFLPSYMFGINPNVKIAIGSYSATQARKFNRLIQRNIDTKGYLRIFPETKLNNSNVVTVSSSYLRNSEEFEIVNHSGSLKAVGRGGALTGNQVDVMIMDDLYKDYMEGNSPVIRENVIDWYTTVVRTRLHNNSQQLIVFTRWHEDDLIGYLEKTDNVQVLNDSVDLDNFNPDTWLKINFEAIKTTQPNSVDPRTVGEALFPERHSIEKLTGDKLNDIEKFECLYQGNPTSASGRLYSQFQTYTQLPQLNVIKCYTDTADTGSDFMLSLVYGVGQDGKIYVIDMLYTQEPCEITEAACASLLIRNNINESTIESNNGGRSFRRNVERLYKDLGGKKTVFKDFTQTQNKESRIISNQATVNRDVILPADCHVRFTQFYENLIKYKRMFKSNTDDAIPDVLSAIVEQENKPKLGRFMG
jgi:predicted phage terminase large subunit-like protein